MTKDEWSAWGDQFEEAYRALRYREYLSDEQVERYNLVCQRWINEFMRMYERAMRGEAQDWEAEYVGLGDEEYGEEDSDQAEAQAEG